MKITDLKNINGLIKIIGTLSEDEISLSTNSKMPNGENLFVALKGDRFDAYNFIEDAISNKAKAFVVTNEEGREEKLKSLYERDNEHIFFLVNDSLKFLQEAAKFRIQEWKNKDGIVFGLTGSNGKTTTKEILFSLAKSFLNDAVVCTQGNLNNHIGVPLTIFSLKDEHKFAIIEMGTNHFGEIETLCEIAQPDFGYITNIGHAHTEFLENLDGVLKEKSALYRWVLKNGVKFYLNCEDAKLATLAQDDKVVLVNKEVVHPFESDIIKESYNQWNIQASAFILENIFSVSLAHELKSVRLPKNKRAQWIDVDKTKIYLDAYNANPTSMNLAIREFAKNIPSDKKVLFVLGDMNELGSETQKHHEDISNVLNSVNAKHAFFIGQYSQYYKNTFKGEAEIYKNLDDLCTKWLSVLNSYDYIFLKASRSLQLERLIDITM
ncbi:UDP-N-acetylmuramoyl-tripeptide--D-alanyl-D-alanine ligase [Halobacteriovorax sp.]|uniref:UDP-N-acetylmuramoyl-tripeptide--D-alanyl-D- alanine ligase n=1 Tax=Halobacteriovorax sp. TaxID=2020862 RepID=UPI003AF314A2